MNNERTHHGDDIMPTKTDLTPSMKKALELAAMNEGYIVAGSNVVKGVSYNVAAPTIDALVRRGIMTRRFSCEGGTAAQMAEEV